MLLERLLSIRFPGVAAALLLSVLAVALPPTLAESPPALGEIDHLPEGLSADLEAVLELPGYRVPVTEGVFELWMRSDIPFGGEGLPGLGVVYGEISPSAVVGVLRLPETWIDYRDTEMGPGLYTLRYFVQPVSSHHMGVSEYRDFLILCRADQDIDPGVSWNEEVLLKLGAQASGRTHPGVVALFPVEEDRDAADIAINEIDQWMLIVRNNQRSFGLVVVGIGDLP